MFNKKLLLLTFLTALFVLSACAQQPTQVTPQIELTDDPIIGQENAPVVIEAFEDFECGFCQKFNLEILPVLKPAYIDTGKVKLQFRDFPIVDKHPMAHKAAEAAECAYDQGKFWEMHDIIFINKNELSVENLKQWAADLQLDTNIFNQCLDSGEKEQEVQEDYLEGVQRGVSKTPTLFVNGVKVEGLHTLDVYQAVIEEELKKVS